MSNNKVFTIIDDNGNETEYEILVAFKWIKTNKNYIVYTDNTKDDLGNLNLYASIYYPDDDTKLESINTDEEWEEIERILNDLK